jgi:DNA-binding PadR family transcriptional regulator
MHVNLISQNTKQYLNRHNANVERMSEAFKKELVQRITRNLLDIQILRLIQTQPMWGYRIKKQTEAKFGVKLRHGVLYPLLNTMEKENFLTSKKQRHGGRTRKTYTITRKGEQYVKAYNDALIEQVEGRDIR